MKKAPVEKTQVVISDMTIQRNADQLFVQMCLTCNSELSTQFVRYVIQIKTRIKNLCLSMEIVTIIKLYSLGIAPTILRKLRYGGYSRLMDFDCKKSTSYFKSGLFSKHPYYGDVMTFYQRTHH